MFHPDYFHTPCSVSSYLSFCSLSISFLYSGKLCNIPHSLKQAKLKPDLVATKKITWGGACLPGSPYCSATAAAATCSLAVLETTRGHLQLDSKDDLAGMPPPLLYKASSPILKLSFDQKVLT